MNLFFHNTSNSFYLDTGAHQSKIVIVKNLDKLPELIQVLEHLISTHKVGSIIVNFPETCSRLIESIVPLGFKFYYNADNSFQYYLWNVPNVPDKVHPHASSCISIGCLILDPEEKNVLMVHEYGKWKGVTGVVELDHSIQQTVEKEVQEETGLTLDSNFGYHLCVVSNCANYNLGGISNNNFIFVVKATDKNVKLDPLEIKSGQYKWIDIGFLLNHIVPVAKHAIETKEEHPHKTATRTVVTVDGQDYNAFMTLALKNYFARNFLTYRNIKGETQFFY